MNPFSSRVVTVLIVAGLATFALGLVLNAFSGRIFGEDSVGQDSYSRSLVGHHALAEFLRQSGLVVARGRNLDQCDLREAFPLLLIEPILHLDSPFKARDALDDPLMPRKKDEKKSKTAQSNRVRHAMNRAWAADAPVVMMLPKWRVGRSPEHLGWIGTKTLRPIEDAEEVIPGEKTGSSDPGSRLVLRPGSISNPATSLAGLSDLKIDLGDTPQLLAADAVHEALVRCDEGVLIGAIRPFHPGEEIIVISDPDLINNSGLARGDHAALFLSLLAEFFDARGVVIDETPHGFEDRGNLKARIFSFPLVLLLIHGVATLLLLAWSAAPRFGKALEPPRELPPGKSLLIDNTSRLLMMGGDRTAAVRRYMGLSMTVVAERFFLLEGSSQKDVLSKLKRLTRMRGLTVDIEKLYKATRSRTLKPDRALKLAQLIHSWRTTMLGADSTED